jgi:hypothetical protein
MNGGIFADVPFVKGMYELAKQKGFDTQHGVPEQIFIEYWEKEHNMKLWEHGIKLMKTTTQTKKGFVPSLSIYVLWNDLENSYPYYKGESKK